MKRNRLFLNIGRKLYALSRVGIQPVVWRLMKLRRGGVVEAIYDVHNDSGEWSCDCGSCMRPGRVCKHRRILREEGIIP